MFKSLVDKNAALIDINIEKCSCWCMLFSLCLHPDSTVGQHNVGPTSVLSSQCWANVSPTCIAVRVGTLMNKFRFCFKCVWNWAKSRVIMVPSLQALAAVEVVIRTTSGTNIADKVGIMITLSFQCCWVRKIVTLFHHVPTNLSVLPLYIDGLVQDCSNSIANALERWLSARLQ